MSHPTRIERANVALEVMLAKTESQRDELLAACKMGLAALADPCKERSPAESSMRAAIENAEPLPQ